MSKVLVVVDVQNDFITGALANPAAEKALPAVRKLVNVARANRDKIIFTMDTHNKDYSRTHEGKILPISHCIQGTWGWKFAIDSPAISDKENIILKQQFGANPHDFKLAIDDDVEQIDICGFVSSICVVSNALILRALYPEADIIFHAYASAGLTPEDHEAACKVMECCQIKVIREAEQLLFYLTFFENYSIIYI